MFVVLLFLPSRENSSNPDSWDVPCSYMDHWWNQGWTRNSVEGLVMHWTRLVSRLCVEVLALYLLLLLFVCCCLMLLLLLLQGSKSEHDTPGSWACDSLPWLRNSLQTYVQVHQMWLPVSLILPTSVMADMILYQFSWLDLDDIPSQWTCKLLDVHAVLGKTIRLCTLLILLEGRL